MAALSSGIKMVISLNRTNKTYKEGELIRGTLQIEAANEFRHEGIVVLLNGGLTVVPMTVLGESSSGCNITLIASSVMVVNPGKIPSGKTDIPFQLTLDGGSNNNVDNQNGFKLFETYHGVKINIDYFIEAEIKRGFLAGNVQAKGVEIFVEYQHDENDNGNGNDNGNDNDNDNDNDNGNGDKITDNETETRHEFVMTPETLRRKKKKIVTKDIDNAESNNVSDFYISGFLSKTTCRLTEPVTGKIVVERSKRPIKSLELQLVRVESAGSDDSIGSKKVRETSEVQNIQIGDGDVLRNIEIPIFMILPRQFVCPTIQTNVFAVGFEINVNVIFNDDYVAAENVPIKIIR